MGATNRRHTLAATGLRGESEALFELRKNGYLIVARRWKSTKLRGDVDLIGWEGNYLCFVEVKTRTERDAVPAMFAVDMDKQQMLHKNGQSLSAELP